MDKIWMKERIHKCFLLIQTRPFIVLVLLIVVLSTILRRIITPCLLVLCSMFTLTCVVLGTGDFFSFAQRAGELTSGFNRRKESSTSHTDMPQDCDHSFDAHGPSRTSWTNKFTQGLREVSCSVLEFVKWHVLPDIDEEGLMAGGLDRRDVCLHGIDMKVANKEAHACANQVHEEDEAGDIPELEDCSTSCEEEEVCKGVLETTAHTPCSHDDAVVVDAPMLQPTNAVKAVPACAYEDEHSVDKHQILPLESCAQCESIQSKGFGTVEFSSGCVCDCNISLRKLEITDAELQNAASEFYTLEGDVLWSESDLKKKQPHGKRLDNGGPDGLSTTTCELCKRGKLSVASENFAIFPSKGWTGATTFARMPVNSSVVYYVDAKKAQEESGSEESVRASAEEDVMIDQELRAIASRSGNRGEESNYISTAGSFRDFVGSFRGNRGEESNYMSTAGSFRDFVGSFREIDGCWPEYDGMMGGRKEDSFITGCCDDHARPCISHSRSRSKVLQSDPLLSKASLIREQEIMDVLWQEYNEDRRQRHSLGKQQRDFAQKQRLKVDRADCSGSSDHVNEVLEDGSANESINTQPNKYVMKLNNAPECGNNDRNSENHCRFGCDKPCWHMAKGRGYHRRRHFVGVCKVLRELGLKQCMQSSKVDN